MPYKVKGGAGGRGLPAAVSHSSRLLPQMGLVARTSMGMKPPLSTKTYTGGLNFFFKVRRHFVHL